MAEAEEINFTVGEKVGNVSGLLLRPQSPEALLVLAHGAGAGMRHRFMEETAQKLADHAIATLRYQFAYMEKGARDPIAKRFSRQRFAARSRPQKSAPMACRSLPAASPWAEE